MHTDLVVRGFLLGFAVAAPVGPIGVLVIRRTLAVGPRTGLVSGLGAATADAAYGCLAVLGLVAATPVLRSRRHPPGRRRPVPLLVRPPYPSGPHRFGG